MKRFLACALAVCLLLGVMPTTAMAASTAELNAMNVRLDAAIAANFHIPKDVYDASQHTLVVRDVKSGLKRDYNSWPEYYAALYDDGTLLVSTDGSGTGVSYSPGWEIEEHAGEVKLCILSDRVGEVPGFHQKYTGLETIVSLYEKPLATEPATAYGAGINMNTETYRPPNLKNIVIYGNIPRSYFLGTAEHPIPPMNIYYRGGYPDWENKEKNSFRFPPEYKREGMKNVTFRQFCSYTYDGGIDLEHGAATTRKEKVLDYTSTAADLYDEISFCSKCGRETAREHHYTVNGKQYNDYTPRELTVNTPSVAEIKAFFAAHPIKSQTAYTRAPAYAQEPYDLGAYDAATRKSIMNEINRYRFVAGVPANLEYNPTYEPQEMAAALVMKVGNQLSHTPQRTNGLEKPQYDDMLTHRWKWGANGANIASWGNIMSAIQAFMWDSDVSNVLAGLGHRRHILKSNLRDVAAGEAGNYACLFVSQTTGSHSGWYDPVAWPARNTPTSYVAGRWSVVYGGDKENLTGHRFRVEILTDDGDFYSTAESGSNTAVLVSDGQVNFGHTLDMKTDTIYSIAVFDDTAKTFMTYDVSFFEYTDAEGHSGSFTDSTEPAPDPNPTPVTDPDPVTDPNPVTDPEPSPAPNSSSDTASVWAKEQVSQAADAGLVPDTLQSRYTQPITRQGFCTLADTLYSKEAPAPITATATFSDSSDPATGRMATVGVVKGVGNNRFDPFGQLTREQAATMLYRLAEAAGKPFPDAPAAFADKGNISSWASKEVGAVQAAGIMNGVGNNRFDPKGTYTTEQSIVTMLRMYEYLTK